MKWIDNTPTPAAKTFQLVNQDIRLNVDSVTGSRHWEYFALSFGEHSDKTAEECKATWPHRAIKEARRQLDEFEKTLNQEQDNADQRSD